MRALIGMAAVAAFVAYCFRRGGQTRQLRGEVKEDLRRWEGEGGNVPSVATPSPVTTAPPSYAVSGSELRH